MTTVSGTRTRLIYPSIKQYIGGAPRLSGFKLPRGSALEDSVPFEGELEPPDWDDTDP